MNTIKTSVCCSHDPITSGTFGGQLFLRPLLLCRAAYVCRANGTILWFMQLGVHVGCSLCLCLCLCLSSCSHAPFFFTHVFHFFFFFILPDSFAASLSPMLTPPCSETALQLTVYIYIYIYMCVCVCVFNKRNVTSYLYIIYLLSLFLMYVFNDACTTPDRKTLVIILQ